MYIKEFSHNAAVAAVIHPLIEKFDQLSGECVDACDAQFKADRDITIRLSEAYLLFLELQQSPDTFAAIYAREGFCPPDANASEPDFTTYVKALFRFELQTPSEADRTREAKFGQQVVKNKVTGYVASLRRMHEEYLSNPDGYRRNGAAKLAQFHQANRKLRADHRVIEAG